MSIRHFILEIVNSDVFDDNMSIEKTTRPLLDARELLNKTSHI
jgi:hypothetical protein